MDEKWRIIYFVSSLGDNPVKEFLDSHISIKAKAFRIFKHIQEYGLTTAIPHLKKLTGTPLWEIRILGQDSARILYVTLSGERILLLHAFIKKSNKTPGREIKTALLRLPKYPIDK